jgi:hypothetical protein
MGERDLPRAQLAFAAIPSFIVRPELVDGRATTDKSCDTCVDKLGTNGIFDDPSSRREVTLIQRLARC